MCDDKSHSVLIIVSPCPICVTIIISTADFIKNSEVKPTAEDVANAVVACASDPQERAGKAFLVSGAGVKLVS